jgi:hypothetical protein
MEYAQYAHLKRRDQRGPTPKDGLVSSLLTYRITFPVILFHIYIYNMGHVATWKGQLWDKTRT